MCHCTYYLKLVSKRIEATAEYEKEKKGPANMTRSIFCSDVKDKPRVIDSEKAYLTLVFG